MNTVAQVALIDYVRLFKDRAQKKSKKKAIRKAKASETLNYVREIWLDFVTTLHKTPKGGDYTPNVFQCKKYIKTVKIAEGHTKKDWIDAIAIIFQEVDKIVKSRLTEIDRKKSKKLAKQNLYISPETKQKQEKERIEFHIGLLNKYLNAGINPFNEEWNADKCPVAFEDLQFEGEGIDSFWIEDQKKMEKIRKVLPDKCEYAENRLQLYNVDLANRLLKHREKLSRNETSTWESYRKQQEINKQAQIKKDMKRDDPWKFIEIYGLKDAF